MVLELKNIFKSFGVQEILKDVSLRVEDDDRIGLLGVNGAGKTTLLRVICGEELPDGGEVSLAGNAVIGYLRQNDGLEPGNNILDEARSVFRELLQTGEALVALGKTLASTPEGEEHHQLMEQYDQLERRFLAGDGYSIERKVMTVLNGMGFGGYDLTMQVEKLSGGEKTRLALAKLLLREPGLLVLDEPTNHLDFAMLSWLEGYLKTYRGALLVVSHDRYFLDNVVRDICELERCTLTRYKGGYSQFVRQKEERQEFQGKQYQQQQEKIKKMEDFVARNIARATTSNMAKSRVHQLANMERIQRPDGELRTAKLEFACDCEPYKQVLEVQGLSMSVGEGESRRALFSGIDFSLEREEKVAIIGQNGVGKSSLLKALLGQLPAIGQIRWGANVKQSFFEQENRQLDATLPALEQLRRRFPRIGDTQLRTLLGTLLITGDDVYKRIGDLSGGERAKVAFALMTLERANVLIFDEPTNHLDYKTKEVLERALCDFSGTILMVSHDRYLLNRVPTRIVEMLPEDLCSYLGGYDDYLQKKAQTASKEPPKSKAPEPAKADNPFYRSKAQRSAQQQQRSKLLALEEEIEGLESEIKTLEAEIALPQTSADYQRLQELCALLEERRHLLSQRSDQWLALSVE